MLNSAQQNGKKKANASVFNLSEKLLFLLNRVDDFLQISLTRIGRPFGLEAYQVFSAFLGILLAFVFRWLCTYL